MTPHPCPPKLPPAPRQQSRDVDLDRDKSPIPTEPMGEQGLKQIPGLGQETSLPPCNYRLPYFGWGLFASSKFSSTFPFSPLTRPCHLALRGEQSGPDQSPGSPPPFSTHPTLLFIVFSQVPIETLVCGPGRKPPCC